MQIQLGSYSKQTCRDIFSNYYQAKVHIFDQDFLDNEHAIQYKKAVVAGRTDLIKEVLEAPNPKRIKEIGDSINTNQRLHEMKQGDICWVKVRIQEDIIGCKWQRDRGYT